MNVARYQQWDTIELLPVKFFIFITKKNNKFTLPPSSTPGRRKIF